MSKLTPCITTTRLWAVLIEAPRRPVSIEVLHGGADPIRIEHLARAGLSGGREEDEPHPLRGPLLVPLQRLHRTVGGDRGVEVNRKLVAAQDLLDLGGQLRRLGE